MKFYLGSGPPADCQRWQETDATADRSGLRHGNGLRHERHAVDLEGRGFTRAREDLLAFRWFPQRLIRSTVCADGLIVVQRFRIGPFGGIVAPVRVAERIVEPRRVAITVVTVRGHPERGVERYELVLDQSLDRATLIIEKAWELADPLARLAAPFSTWLQAYATRASLRRFGSASQAR